MLDLSKITKTIDLANVKNLTMYRKNEEAFTLEPSFCIEADNVKIADNLDEEEAKDLYFALLHAKFECLREIEKIKKITQLPPLEEENG